MATAGRLQVEIVARMEKFEAALSKVEGQLKKTGSTVDSALATPGAKFALNMGKVFAAMGAVEMAAKSASVVTSFLAAKGAENAGNAEESAKHFEAMSETIKSMPMGIGPVATAIEDLMHKALGLTDAFEAGFAAEERASGIEKFQARTKEYEKELEMLEEREERAGAINEFHLAEIELHQKFRAAQRESNEARKKIFALTKADGVYQEAELARVEKLRDLKSEIINQEEIQRINAQIKQKEDEEEAKRVDELRAKKIDALKEEMKLLQEAIKEDEKRLKISASRLGIGSQGTMGEKSGSGLTGTISTAFGSFTSAEMDLDNKIADLQQQRTTIQQDIAQDTKTIQQLLVKLTANMGIS
tara:strand:+ start:3450 stop:4526 length:1077 start_codon:yes stop_codon:yes gene_type:complete